jgi:hypothetical protein
MISATAAVEEAIMSDSLIISRPSSLKQALGHRRGAAGHAVTGGLHLAATPVFAVMALLTALGGEPDMLCAAMLHVSPLDGMTPMYLLMAAFHSGPWLRLLFGR